MKSKLILLITFSCFLFAQEEAQPEVPGWGIYGGLGLMSAYGDDAPDDPDFNILPGGGVSGFVMAGPLPMQVGVGIHGRGVKTEFSGIEASMSANYLDFWATVPFLPVGPAFLSAGFQVGTFLSGKSKVGDTETDLEKDDYALDYGLNFGAGYPIGDTGAQVGVLYLLGLAKHGGDDGDTKWNGIFLNAGYSF